MILNEMVQGKPILEETSREKLPDGVLCRVSYPICDIGKRNANKRVYEADVWEGVHADSGLKDKLENRALFGHAEHPEQTQSNLEKTSHVIFEMWNDGQDREWQKFDVLDTPTGRIVDCLLRAGCRVGCSTRAEGDLEEAEDDEGSYQKVVAESYKYITTDFTADPSTFGSVPHDIKRNVVSEVKKMFETKDVGTGEIEFAEKVLESMTCKKTRKAIGRKHKCQHCGACEALEERKVLKENKTVSILLENGTITEGATVKYGAKDAKVEKIEEGNVTLSVGDVERTDVTVNGNANVSVSVTGVITILPEEVMAIPDVGQEEVPAELDVEPAAEPVDDIPVDDMPVEDELEAEPELDDMDKDVVPESRLTKESLTAALGKVVKILEGEHKDKEGKLTEISEGAIGITLDDGTIVNIEDPTSINITVTSPPEPEPELEEEPVVEPELEDEVVEPLADEEIPEAKEEGCPKCGNLAVGHNGLCQKCQEEAERQAKRGKSDAYASESVLDEVKAPTAFGVSDKLDAGNLLKDKDGKSWTVTEVTNSRLLITQLGAPGTEKSLSWDEVPGWGFTKLAERELAKDPHAVVVRATGGGWGVWLTGDGKDRWLAVFSDKDAAVKRAEKVAGDGGIDYTGVEESVLDETGFKSVDRDHLKKLVNWMKSVDQKNYPYGNLRTDLEKAEEALENLGKSGVKESAVDETADINKMYSDAGLPTPDGKGEHTKAFHKLAVGIAKDYVKSGDSPKEALSKAYPTAMKQLGRDKAVKKAHQRNESISTTVKEIKSLKLQEAVARSERDKAIELLEDLTNGKQQFESKVAKGKALEIKMLVSRMSKTLEAKEQEVNALRFKLEEKAKLAADQKKLVSEARANSLKGITSLTEAVVSEAKVMKDDWAKSDAKHAQELNQLSEALKVEEKKHKESCEVLKEKITKEVTAAITEQFIKRFVEFRLSESNLKVDENSRALLEQSTSLEDVDNLLDDIVDASRRSALHSEAVRGIRVPQHTMPDPEGDRIKRSVNNIFEGMNG